MQNALLADRQGCEEAVLSLLLELCSHTGLSLLWRSTGSELGNASIMSLNVVNDEEDQVGVCDCRPNFFSELNIYVFKHL